jgi:selenium-binding protein 1
MPKLRWFKSGVFAVTILLIGTALAFAADQDHRKGKEKTLYIWAGDQAHKASDFLAVIDFDAESADYGKVIKTVPLPPPGNIGNEAHHCHLNSTGNLLGCGGLLSVLKGQNGIFFFDVSEARNPRFLFSAKAVESAITDDFLPTEDGGFLISQMGSATGGAPGRIAEFDGQLHFVGNHFGETSMFQEFPKTPPVDGFNPHGISARPDLNVMTADFILPSSTLTGSAGPELRGSVRVWNYKKRKLVSTINLLSPNGGPALGTMDVKMLPKDPTGIAYTAGMFDGHIYAIDPIAGTGIAAFDMATVTPHVKTDVTGGMGQILATPQSGDRLLVGMFQAGQVAMLDTTYRLNLKQVASVTLGPVDSGPHNMVLSADDSRLVVTDYFLNEDGAGIIHFEGDHKVHVVKVTHDTLTLDTRFNLDFNTAFPTGPARPHGIAMK